jgi:hypothetical protein
MKRKPRETWATRKLPPLTLAEIERHLDLVARMMVRAGPKADLLLPIWRRLEYERDARREADNIIAAARERVQRSQHQTAARS